MTLNVNKPVQTRDGRKARIICTDRNYDEYPLIVLVADEYGQEMLISYKADGGCAWDDLDLVNVPEETVKFVEYNGGDSYAWEYDSLERLQHDGPHSQRQFVFKVTKIDGKAVKVELVNV